MVNDVQLATRLREILDVADLEVTTEKTIRTQLQEEFGIDLSQRKKFIRQEVEAYLTRKQAEGGESDEDDAEDQNPGDAENESSAKKRKAIAKGAKDGKTKDKKERRSGGGLLKVCALSDELAALLGAKELPRTEVVKSMWNYIREKNLQDPSNKRLIICNEDLKKLLKTDSTDMFQLNKLLTVHIKSIPSANGELPPAKRPKTGGGGGGKGGFSIPLPMSPSLIKFLGSKETSLPRSEVVKRMWAYIKEKGLQDPSNRRNILCDGPLKELLKTDGFNGFGMTKLLSPHFLKKNSSIEDDENDGGDDESQ